MASMVRWALAAWFVSFIIVLGLLLAWSHGRGDLAALSLLSILAGTPAAILVALFAGVKLILTELRETQRLLKHWHSIQSLDVDLDESRSRFQR
jgi:hypothetical protein